ncbi:MAG: ZIP family metal transporter [Pyrinomonadaceae bacterium MAG19_C2-C3]|nr:ZIP family metal transporter [Pyrinomonadaceae bacterium MAG19_C2-C3]
MNKFGSLVFLGSVLTLGNVLGGLFLIYSTARKKTSVRLLRNLLGTGAGFMLAAVFLELLPQIIEAQIANRENAGAAHGVAHAMLLVLSGYLFLLLVEQFIASHVHFPPLGKADLDGTLDVSTGGTVNAAQAILPTTGYTVLTGLAVHTFFDGVMLATSLLVDFEFGFLVFVALLLHKIPEGFTAASIVAAAGGNRRQSVFATLFIGATTFSGALAVAYLDYSVGQLLSYALPFAAGVTLYITATDLIPELKHGTSSSSSATGLFVIGGVILFYLIHILIDAV